MHQLKHTEINVDTSPVGLGAILAKIDPETGKKKAVAYARRDLINGCGEPVQPNRALSSVSHMGLRVLPLIHLPVTVFADYNPWLQS